MVAYMLNENKVFIIVKKETSAVDLHQVKYTAKFFISISLRFIIRTEENILH